MTMMMTMMMNPPKNEKHCAKMYIMTGQRSKEKGPAGALVDFCEDFWRFGEKKKVDLGIQTLSTNASHFQSLATLYRSFQFLVFTRFRIFNNTCMWCTPFHWIAILCAPALLAI